MYAEFAMGEFRPDTGHHYDDNTGLVDMKAPWYPAAGRFLTSDTYPGTLDDPYTQHRYAYVGNNPLSICGSPRGMPEWVRDKRDHIETVYLNEDQIDFNGYLWVFLRSNYEVYTQMVDRIVTSSDNRTPTSRNKSRNHHM